MSEGHRRVGDEIVAAIGPGREVRRHDRNREQVLGEAEQIPGQQQDGSGQRHEQAGHDERGQDAPGAAQVELAETDTQWTLTAAQQQLRDQVTGDDVEEVNADVAPSHPRDTRMEQDDQDDSHGPETVDIGSVGR